MEIDAEKDVNCVKKTLDNDAASEFRQTPTSMEMDNIKESISINLDSGDSCDDTASISTVTTNTSRSKSPTRRKAARRKRKHNTSSSKFSKSLYKFRDVYREHHGMSIFGAQFNPFLKESAAVFATVGNNRLTIYKCGLDEKASGLTVLQMYEDPDPDENFYTCAWSYDANNSDPIIAAAGNRGIIRVFNTNKQACLKHFIGHGQAINELKFHPLIPQVLLSGSKDHSLRLWNIQTDVCIAVFGGVEGHRDEVLSLDFNNDGTRIMSSGMDHSLKLWRLDKEDIKDAIEKSFTYNSQKMTHTFPTVKEHFPDFSTRDIHRNYVDCVQWNGDCIYSKSCENSIVCWKPGTLAETEIKERYSTTTNILQLDLKECELWFVRFAFNTRQKLLALGNQLGKTYVWELDENDPKGAKCSILSHQRCTSLVRQTTFTRNGNILICVCDDGTVWRWDRA